LLAACRKQGKKRHDSDARWNDEAEQELQEACDARRKPGLLGEQSRGQNPAREQGKSETAERRPRRFYQEKCRSCHQNAAELARSSLVASGGTVLGRQSGRPLADFLPKHARLTADELSVLVESLTRVYREVHGP
jgi:hypothetical protein